MPNATKQKEFATFLLLSSRGARKRLRFYILHFLHFKNLRSFHNDPKPVI